MLTLFRLIDQLAGRILIDGVDIASLGIDALRSQLAIIPQVWSLSDYLPDISYTLLAVLSMIRTTA